MNNIQIIFESFRKSMKESNGSSPAQRNNWTIVSMILARKDRTSKTLFDKAEFLFIKRYNLDTIENIKLKEDDNFKQILKEVSNILINSTPPLKNNIIKSSLGSGNFSTAFLLDNGHVFKYFPGGQEKIVKWYEELQQRLFSGSEVKTAPVIYDYGKVEFGGESFFYVEMSRILPLNNLGLPDLKKLTKILTYVFYRPQNPHQEFSEIKQSLENNKKRIFALDIPKEIILSMIRTYFEYYIEFGLQFLFDAKYENIGYIHGKVPTFIFFDPFLLNHEPLEPRVPATLIKHK